MDRSAALLVLCALVTLPFQARSSECSPGALHQLLDKTLRTPIVKEIAVSDRESTEGSAWQIRSIKKTAHVSISRIDFGEGGQQQSTIVFLDRRNFAIRTTTLTYREPIYASKVSVVERRVVRDYYYCGEITYPPINNAEPNGATNSTQESVTLRKRFFETSELAKYLPK